MSENPDDEVFETGALHEDATTEDQALEGLPKDFEPEPGWEDEHSKHETGGPGGVVNYPKRTHPKDWAYVEGVSTPKVER